MTDSQKKAAVNAPIPFVGLRPFDSADHHWFHGRDREIAALLRKVRNNRFTAVVGASGSGKSSLVRAGILAPLAEDGWQTILAKPGSAPIARLAAALSETAHSSFSVETATDNLAEARAFRYDALLRQSAYGLAEIGQQLAPDAPRLVLVIDQFEELFRYGEEAQGAEKAAMAEESRAFVELLLTAASQSSGRLHVILTMRSDFFGNCAAYDGLADAVSASQYLVPLPRRDQMQDIIRKPVLDAGGAIDETLVQRLLLEVTEQTDHLPALQHTLRRLWEMAPVESGQRRLREEDYQRIGGIAGSIDFKAEQIAAGLRQAHPEDFSTLESIMKAITDLDEQSRATRRPQKCSALSELLTEMTRDKQKAEASLDRVLKALASEEISFIQLGGGDDPETDIGHEALIRSWRRLCGEERRFKTGWLVEEREDGRHWRDLARREKNSLGMHLSDAWQARRWIRRKKIGPVWTSRYGDAWETIRQFIRESLIKNGVIVVSILSAITVVLTISIGLAWMNYELAQNSAREALRNLEQAKRQEAETIRQARAAALVATGYAKSFVDSGNARTGALIALRVMPESRRRDDPSYVHEAGFTFLNALAQPIEVRRWMQPSPISSFAVSPDGSYMVSVDEYIILRLWNVSTGKQIHELTSHDDRVTSIAFSPDNRRVASASLDGTIRLWDVQTGEQTGQPIGYSHIGSATGPILSVAFSPDGDRIVSGSGTGKLRIWDSQTGAQIGEPLTGHQGAVTSVAFSHDGSRIVSGGEDKTVRMWNVQTGEAVGEPLTGHEDAVTSIAFSPVDNTLIATGSYDNTVRVWRYGRKDISEIIKFTGHQGPVNSVVFSPDGSQIVSAGVDETVRIWNMRTRKQIGTPLTGREVKLLTGHESSVTGAAFLPGGNFILSSSQDKTFRIWDVQINKPIGEPLEHHKYAVSSVAFSPDGGQIVSGSNDGKMYMYDMNTYELVVNPYWGHIRAVTSVAYSPDGSRIVSGSDDKTLRLWDVQTGQMIDEPLKGHESSVYSVAFSPDGSRIVSGSSDKTLRIWDVQTSKPIGEPLKGHENRVLSVAFSPNGSRIVSGSSDKTLRIWDALTGKLVGEPLKGHENSVYSVAFSSDGSRIVSGSSDKTLRIWDVQTGQSIGDPFKSHEDSVYSVAFSPDGSRIVSGSSDSTLRIWDTGLFTATLKELVEKAEKLCPLSLKERQQLHLIDPQTEAAQRPLTPDQQRACGM
ncbi:MAG: AAA family ATPase [Burkholderiales bacterium]|nr:AAA family ATPase [Burkholderiales bacterium]